MFVAGVEITKIEQKFQNHGNVVLDLFLFGQCHDILDFKWKFF